ncbi:MAG: F0F1 ATP synthase subunit epsilon [Candidatus Binatia bacterium]|jgi:F-type H+-transporting ATPase subunit epsilon
MRDRFQLRIVTPRQAVLDEEVREVTAPGSLGEFGVLPDHITFLTSLEIGALRYRTDGEPQRLAIRGGFAEVADNVMTVLADDAMFPDDIDQQAARADLTTAEEQLRELSPVDPAFSAADANRRWAQARLEVAAGNR